MLDTAPGYDRPTMQIAELRRELAAVAAGLEPRSLSTADARAALEDMTAIRNIVACVAGKLAQRAAEGCDRERARFASEWSSPARQARSPSPADTAARRAATSAAIVASSRGGVASMSNAVASIGPPADGSDS